MSESSTSKVVSLAPMQELFGALRPKLRELVEELLDAELDDAIAVARHERGKARKGYRHGHEAKEVVTEVGRTTLSVPRGRMFTEDGGFEAWNSAILPRYQRRTRKVDETILGCYLAGANTRKIRRALAPLLGEKNLSRSAISRVVSRLKERFKQWQGRDLSEESYVYVFLDATRLPIRIARRVVKVPVHAVLGVREDGQKVLVSLTIAGSESTGSWTAVVEGLLHRGLPAPQLVVLDGNAGLLRAVRDGWPKAQIQRCTRHKLENLLEKAPKHSHPELTRDYHEIVYADSRAQADRASKRFVRKWSTLSEGVVASLEEAGSYLLTFYEFPQSQWKSLRTTNRIERLNEEFRRRTKTQGSFRTESSALVLLYGLVAFGYISLRKIDGYREMDQVTGGASDEAA
jgi:putative transposase